MNKGIFLFIMTVFCSFLSSSCVHQTAMSDGKLTALWQGNSLPEPTIMAAKQEWPNDATLIDMQQGINLLRRGKLNSETIEQAHTHLESAYGTFENLRDPENFSKAFTADDQTPYRGRPFERMMSAMLLALLDTTKGRCDMALPALKAAEFLDARWQPFLFGSDAPMIYALMLRCFHQTQNQTQDFTRAKEGLTLALRMQLVLEPFFKKINEYTVRTSHDPATQAALVLLEVGIPSALLSAPADANLEDITQIASSEAIAFLPRVLAQDEAPYDAIIRPLLKKIDAKSGNNEATANAIFQLQAALKNIWKNILSKPSFSAQIEPLLQRARSLTSQIETAAKKPVMTVYFDGTGPRMQQEGEYNEIGVIVPSSPQAAIAGVSTKEIQLTASCGVSNWRGNLIFTLCSNTEESSLVEYKSALKLWSSSFQAMTTAGRKFDRILKGRAQFRMGTEIAAIIGGYTALALLDASTRMQGESARNMQTAALVVGALAGAAWIAGRATNPEADIRQVHKNFESGYLLLP